MADVMADAATPIGALEDIAAQCLQTTKSDMLALRTHMAGLEQELEQLSTANGGLQRQLKVKAEMAERQARRAEMQQERLFELEGELATRQRCRLCGRLFGPFRTTWNRVRHAACRLSRGARPGLRHGRREINENP